MFGELSASGIGEHIILSTKHGQQYQCSFRDKKTENEKEENQERTAKEAGISELLRPLEDGPCLIANKGWWTYEFCYRRHIHQYHVEDGKVSGVQLVLGVYSSEYNWSDGEQDRVNKERLRRYHSQQYNNGTECDVTAQPRRTEVRFVCDDSSGDYVSHIEESESCVYVITVNTPRTCHHPYLKPPRQNKAVPITCNPVLSQPEYDDYITELKEQTNREEEIQRTKAKYLADANGRLSAADIHGDKPPQSSDGGHLGRVKVLNKFKEAMVDSVKESASKTADDVNIAYEIFKDPKSAERRAQLKRDREMMDQDDWQSTDDTSDKDIMNEFTEGLEEIITDPDTREMLPAFRDEIQAAMTEQFDEIINEAQNELLAEGVAAVDRGAALLTLANTLRDLLKRLDASTKDLDDAQRKLELAAMKAAESREKLLKKLRGALATDKDDGSSPESPDADQGVTEKLVEPSAEPHSEPSAEPPAESADSSAEPSDESSKVLKSLEDSDQMSLTEDQRRQLENQVKDELRKAGLNTEGQKIHIQIVTASRSVDGKLEIMSSSDTKALNRMVVAILGRDGGEDAEANRQSKLESAYEYRWQPGRKRHHQQQQQQQQESSVKPTEPDDSDH